jgi:hypothetical protein
MVSAEYKNNIYPPKGMSRKTVAEVVYSLSAPGSKEGGSTNISPGNAFSRPEQVMNEIRRMNAPIGTFEPDYWSLDGSFIIPVPPEEQQRIEVGYWSREISGGDGYFGAGQSPSFRRVFDSVKTFNRLGVTFDTATGNCCSEFDVYYMDANHTFVYFENVTGNGNSVYYTKAGGIDILEVHIVFLRTNIPYRHVRIIEIDFGLVLTYGDKDIISLNTIREADPMGKRYAYPELRLSIVNNGEYDLFDPESYAPYFLRRQRFEYKHGLVMPDKSVEWVDCGTYYLTDWKVSDSRVEFRASGVTFEMEKSVYYESTFQEFTLEQLVRRIIPHSKINVESPNIPGYFGNVDYRKALTYLAELSCCLVYEDRENIVQFNDFISGDENTVDEINYSNIIGASSAKTSEYYNAISLAEYDVSVEERQISKTRHAPGEIMIVFGNPIMGEPEIEITPGFLLTDIIWRTMYMTARLTAHATFEAEAEITITGESITLSKKDNLYYAPWHTGREELRAYKVDLPFFIKSSVHYAAMRDWFLSRKFEALKKQLEVSVRWRGNPARDVFDCIDMVFSKKGHHKAMHITKSEMKYNGGALSGHIAAVGDNPLLVRGG